jgi:prepilin peptidase CpaA
MIDPDKFHSILLSAAATALLIAAAHDVAVRTVPNLVPLIVVASGLGMNALDGHFIAALCSASVVFVAVYYCWRRSWIGGGDVKLLAACATLVPPVLVPELILSTTLSGGLLALFYLALARLLPRRLAPGPTSRSSLRPFARPTRLLRRIWRIERRRISRGLSLPYACAISVGVLLTLTIAVPSG